jgi:hypothetical protein
MPSERRVTLRDEVYGPDRRSLWAYFDSDGNLRIDGQDLGPKTAMVSEDGEYEWFQTIKKADLPRLRELLGADDREDLLDVLEARWSGSNSYDLERLLRDGDIEVERFVWG